MVAWVFRRLGAASAHPSAKEYLAPLRMKVGSKLFRTHRAFLTFNHVVSNSMQR